MVNCYNILSLLIFFILFQITKEESFNGAAPMEPSYDGAKEFQQFENRLAESAKEKKGELLKNQIKSILKRSKDVIKKFKGIVEASKKLKLDRLTEKVTSIDTDDKELSKTCSTLKGLDRLEEKSSSINDDGERTETCLDILKNLEASFTQAKSQFISQFEVDVKNGRSEEEAREQLCNRVNEKLKATVSRKKAITNEKLTKWYNSKKSVFSLTKPEMQIKEGEIAQMNSEELPKDKYDPNWDFHSYYTSNYVWAGCLLSGGVAALTGIGVGE